ncbi:MAG: hypothetical protein ACODAG_09260 [Myxococcota bacterium]
MSPSQSGPRKHKPSNAPVIWIACLLFAICFEGQIRKYVTLPDAIFYFMKDAVLVTGLLMFGIRRDVLRSARWAYGGFVIVLAGAFLWTVMQAMNPEHRSLLLAGVGLRAYWLWWIAPLVIASAIRHPEQRSKVVGVLVFTCFVVAGVAFMQFASPSTSDINAYAWDASQGGKDMHMPAVVGSTKKVRVSSTFSYVTGFTDFVILVPGLLLAFALGQTRPWMRRVGFAAVVLTAASIPTSGSRGPVVLSGLFLVTVVLSSGIVRSKTARRAIVAAAVALPLAVLAAPEAVKGLSDRWEGEDTGNRIMEVFKLLPPVAMTSFEYPLMGVGTGMEQNARVSMRISNPYHVESPEGRFLVELGILGYLLIWFARIGLAVALLKAGLRLRRSGRMGIGGACFGFAALTMLGNLVFDHIWQALYFTGLGLLLSSLRQARAEQGAGAIATSVSLDASAPRRLQPQAAAREAAAVVTVEKAGGHP